MRVGPQIEEVLREHLGMDSGQARQRTAKLFDSVGLAEPELIGRRYPHQLSGGDAANVVVIAMSLACEPDLLIMDEPTTGLDVTTEATILDLVVDLKQRVNAGILYVSHNLGVVARVADRVVVMYAGQTVEQGGRFGQLFKSPKHPYTHRTSWTASRSRQRIAGRSPSSVAYLAPSSPRRRRVQKAVPSLRGARWCKTRVKWNRRRCWTQEMTTSRAASSGAMFDQKIWGEAEPREKDTIQGR